MKSSVHLDDKLVQYLWEPEQLSGYRERGVEKGAKWVFTLAEDKHLRDFYSQIQDADVYSTLVWTKVHRNKLGLHTGFISVDDGTLFKEDREGMWQFFMMENPLNEVRNIDILLQRVNEALEDDGYVWMYCRTAVMKYKLLISKYPPGIYHIVFVLYYIFHHVMPKLMLTRKLYFFLTKGKHRSFSRVELLGRLYRAGFEVVDESMRHGVFCVLARKVKAPITDDTPSRSPLIMLRRVGKDGKFIGVYKFRTMYCYSEYLQPYIYEYNKLAKGGKFDDDYRVTPLGHFMRKFWIDELPMIWNMLRGDMKLVGVRPLSKHYFSLYTPEMQKLRTKVKPGLLPPFYAERTAPKTIEDVQESEARYIREYLKHPLTTDIKYLFRIAQNILLKGARSK